jgi:hypothetical protein
MDRNSVVTNDDGSRALAAKGGFGIAPGMFAADILQ